MSKDVQLAFRCPHQTVEERVNISSDRKTLATSQPIASFASIRVLVNDQFYVPSTGYFSRATVRNSLPGPYKINKYENELIINNNSSTYTITLNLGSRVTTDDIVIQIKKILDNENISVENVSGFIELSDITTTGSNSKLKISGSAVNNLFFTQTGSVGRLLYPGWTLLKLTGTSEFKYIRFNQVVNNNPIFKITYTSDPRFCLRCQGSYVENDYRFDQSGGVILIADDNLLYQSVLKIILTTKGSNPFHTNYGTKIQSYIGSKAVIGVANTIKEDVRRALENLKTLQNSQSNYQVVSYKERLYQISSVVVLPNEEDPTVFNLEVAVKNASNQPLSISIIYTVPDVVALLETNGKVTSLNSESAGLILNSSNFR